MVIFVYGENAYLATKQVEEMRKRFIEKFDASGMNLVEFDDNKIALGEVMQATQSPPFLSDKRMVILKGLLGTIKKKADAEPWIDRLKKTPESTIVILFDKDEVAKIEKHQLFKAFKSHQEVHIYPFPALSGTQLTAWARSHAQRIGLKIDDRLLQQVIAMVGSDVWQLSLELEKLAAYAGGQPVIEEMIRELVRANFEDQIFDFVDAVSNHQPKQALQLLAEQRLSGSTDQHLFAMLARQVRLLLGACDLLDQNPRTTKKDLADALGVHPFVAQKTLAQAGKMNASTLHHLHDMLFEFDQKMKGGGIAPDIAVDRLVAEMLA